MYGIVAVIVILEVEYNTKNIAVYFNCTVSSTLVSLVSWPMYTEQKNTQLLYWSV